MHDQATHDVAADEARIDFAILALLLDDDAQRPWSHEEIAREIGDPTDASAALDRLYGAGLIHRLGGFVFATRPAVRGGQLARS